jgi:purine-binding chemotaxis protein CheW
MSGGGSEQQWEDLARSASGRDEHPAIEELRQFLTLRVDDTTYAVPVEAVREIVRMRPVTPLPRVAEEVRGVISLRGEIIQIVDLRRRLRLPPVTPGRRSRIIVLQVNDELTAGLLVDGVSEVLRAAERDIGPPLCSESGAVEALIKRGDTFVSLLDLDRVMEVGDA